MQMQILKRGLGRQETNNIALNRNLEAHRQMLLVAYVNNGPTPEKDINLVD